MHAEVKEAQEEAKLARADKMTQFRRIAAIDCAAYGYWGDGPPEFEGKHDPLIEHILEMRDAWLGLWYTTLAADRIRRQHAEEP